MTITKKPEATTKQPGSTYMVDDFVHSRVLRGRKQEGKRDALISMNCVDKCLLALDGINEPMIFHIVLRLEGEIDPYRLNQAIQSAQEAHPVMRSFLRNRFLRPFREIQDDLEGTTLTVQQSADTNDTDHERFLCQWMNQPMDISKGFPLRVLMVKGSDTQSSLVFTFHHSAADALRAVLFLRKVVDSYNNTLNEHSKSFEVVRLSHKGDELLKFANSQRRSVQRYYIKMISSLFRRFVIDAFSPPTRVFHDQSGQAKEFDFCYEVVGATDLEQIESKAKSVGVELNDILLAACYRTVEKWNGIHGKVSKRIRIMVPVNISPKGFRHVVSNQVSWLSLSTAPEDRSDPVKLLQKVRSLSVCAAENRMAFSLVYFFYFSSRFPLSVMRLGCRFLMTTRTYVDSILLSNAGVVWSQVGSEEPAVTSIGNPRIIYAYGLAPVVTPMGLSLVAITYNDNLSISLTYRRALFSKEKAQQFFDLYLEEVKNYRVSSEEPYRSLRRGILVAGL
jgi:NRPS condensation-like uncharacterized protein